MLAAKNRLRRAKDIREVLRQGARVSLDQLQVASISRSPNHKARIAVVVGKRVHKNAVARHRIQRLVREAARDILTPHPVGYDMVIVARPRIIEIKKVEDIRQSIQLVNEFLEKQVL